MKKQTVLAISVTANGVLFCLLGLTALVAHQRGVSLSKVYRQVHQAYEATESLAALKASRHQ